MNIQPLRIPPKEPTSLSDRGVRLKYTANALLLGGESLEVKHTRAADLLDAMPRLERCKPVPIFDHGEDGREATEKIPQASVEELRALDRNPVCARSGRHPGNAR